MNFPRLFRITYSSKLLAILIFIFNINKYFFLKIFNKISNLIQIKNNSHVT